MILCEWDAPEGDPGQSCVHLFARILSTSFGLVSIFSVCCYSIVSISMVSANEYSCTCTQELKKHWRFNSILNKCTSRIIFIGLPIRRGLVRLNVCVTYPFKNFYACCTIVLADLPTMWGDVVFYYQTTPYSQISRRSQLSHPEVPDLVRILKKVKSTLSSTV
jgi:hypothetical protein